MNTRSDVTVRARALIPLRGGIVVVRERRRGSDHLSVPGGRVCRGEGVIDALRREVAEEVGIDIEIGALLYAFEVRAPVGRQDLNLLYAAEPIEGQQLEHLEVLRPDDEGDLLPPVKGLIGSEPTGVWLGNLWDPALGR